MWFSIMIIVTKIIMVHDDFVGRGSALLDMA